MDLSIRDRLTRLTNDANLRAQQAQKECEDKKYGKALTILLGCAEVWCTPAANAGKTRYDLDAEDLVLLGLSDGSNEILLTEAQGFIAYAQQQVLEKTGLVLRAVDCRNRPSAVSRSLETMSKLALRWDGE